MLTKNPQSIRIDSLKLESGAALPEIDIAYHTYGTLNADGSNAVIVLHALTGSSAAHEWWSGLVGEGLLLDPSKYFIIAPNLLGSCYGTTGPESDDPSTGRPYLATFPTITPRDVARANLALLDRLGISQIHFAIGGSLGGMVVLEMAALAPDRFRAIIPIAVSGSYSAWRVAFSSFIRKAIIASDPTLQDRTKLADGMKLARQAAMISYRSSAEFDARFGRQRVVANGSFEVESYLEHQGEKLAARFSPYSYLTLTRAMELYDLSDGHSAMQEGGMSIECKALFVGISSDILYGADEIKRFASLLPNGRYRTLHAIHGHDSFLVDTEALSKIIAPFLEELEPQKCALTFDLEEEGVAV
ncbi:MAG TPA: homoserine O-acetyltransferase [Candidatus Kapabacteria bacterium]|nr:homoserine O-acetyltransferase [Candidatus Kapabacteria bacterium]